MLLPVQTIAFVAELAEIPAPRIAAPDTVVAAYPSASCPARVASVAAPVAATVTLISAAPDAV